MSASSGRTDADADVGKRVEVLGHWGVVRRRGRVVVDRPADVDAPADVNALAVGSGAYVPGGFSTYHVMNPYDDGVGLDEYVDWLNDAGYPIQRIPGYDAWLQRFDTALRALPDTQRQA